jgi:FtsP/CotA-like multicopper oxidase with cupredoxin domain
MGDEQDHKISVQPGKTYLIRMVNMGAFAGQYVWFEGHTMRVVEVDGIYTEPKEAKQLYITAAQRYSVLVTMKDDASANFPIVGSMDEVRLLRSQISYRSLTRDTGPLRYDSCWSQSQRDRMARLRR